MSRLPISAWCQRHLNGLLAGALFVATLALFAPAIGYDFVGLDDEAYVAENPMTRNGFTRESWAWAWTAVVVGHWAPLLWLSYMVDGTLFGPEPWGFHLTNVLLHALNGVLLFALLCRWTDRRWAAFWAALLWAAHPLRVESVAWIAERKDVFSGLFFLLGLQAYTRGVTSGRPGRRWVWAAVAFLGAGLLVKPVLVTVPVVLLLLDVGPLRRMEWTCTSFRKEGGRLACEKWPFVLLALGLGAVVWRTNVTAGLLHAHMPGWGERLRLIPGNYLVYLQQTVWPAGLSVLYPRPEFHAVRLVVAAMILLGLSAAAWQVRLHRPGVLSGWVWFLVMLVPSIGFFWMGTTEGAGDRFSYLPAMGLMLAVVCALPRFGRGRCLWIVAGSVSVLGAGVATLRQLPIWQHSGTMFGRVLEVMPDHFQANLNRGIWLAEAGRAAEAQEHYRRAWEVSARNRPEVMGKAAYDWALAGQASRALDLLAPARYDVRATPLIHAAAGMACLHAGHLPDAIWHLNQALALEPGTEEYRVELVRACFESGAEDKAREHAARLMTWPGRPIRTADDLYPFYLQRWRDGARPYAWEYFRRLIEAQPDCIPLLNNLAWLAATDGDAPPDALADAEEYARRAVGLAGEQNAAVQDTWAAVLAARGDFDAAVKTAARARHAAEAQGQAQLARRIDARLATYHRQQPWRE